MTRFLFGEDGNGPEYYEKAHDSLMQPLPTSNIKRIGIGQHRFTKQTGRLPLNRAGTRSAAQGTFPSHWEPGMGYSESIPHATNVSNFATALGRCELHLSGMRGAPPKASLAADFAGPARPQSAMAMLRAGGAPGGLPKRRAPPAEASRPIPEGPKKHIQVASFTKQLSREAWTSKPIR